MITLSPMGFVAFVLLCMVIAVLAAIIYDIQRPR